MKRIAFLANAPGVGQSTLVYHLGFMLAELGHRVLLVDLDPRASLTAMCVPETRLEDLWSASDNDPRGGTIERLLRAGPTYVEPLRERIGLVPGDLALSVWEEGLAESWVRVRERQAPAEWLQVVARAVDRAAEEQGAEMVLMDLPANLGAVNRAALLAADHVVTPMTADLFSIRGVQCLGQAFTRWHAAWSGKWASPVGYVITQGGMRLSRPVQNYEHWLRQIPIVFHRYLLGHEACHPTVKSDDRWNLGMIPHLQGLLALARDARKPMYELKPADGAVGALMESATLSRQSFESVARSLLERVYDPLDGL